MRLKYREFEPEPGSGSSASCLLSPFPGSTRVALFCNLALLLFAANLNSLQAQSPPQTGYGTSHLQTIEIPDESLISMISYFSIAENGNMVIVDGGGRMAYLYKSAEQRWMKLDAEKCHPGFEMAPVNAVFLEDGGIFMGNSIIYGYRFGKDGSCMQVADDLFVLAKMMAGDNRSGGFITVRQDLPYEPPALRLHDENGKEVSKYAMPELPYPRLYYRTEHRGLIQMDDGSILFSDGISGDIIRFAPDGSYLDKLNLNLPGFRRTNRDKRDAGRDISRMMQEMKFYWQNFSMIFGIHKLNGQQVVISYSNNQTEGDHQHVLYDISTGTINTISIPDGHFLIGSGFGKLYLTAQPAGDENYSIYVHEPVKD